MALTITELGATLLLLSLRAASNMKLYARLFMLLWVIPLCAVMLYQAIRGPGAKRWGLYTPSSKKYRLPVEGTFSRIFVGSAAALMIILISYVIFSGEPSR
jgi:hypothetical protein